MEVANSSPYARTLAEAPEFFGLTTRLRPDGRESAKAMRPAKVELGVVKGPQGSARCSQGLTRAFATVVGPLEFRSPSSASRPTSDAVVQVSVKQLSSSPVGPRLEAASAAARAASVCGETVERQRAAARSAFSTSSGKTGEEKRALEWRRSFESRLQTLLETALCLDQFPRTLIQVVVLLQQDDGSRDAVCFNAAMAALLDAGLPLRWRGWASCVACLTSGEPGEDKAKSESEQGRYLVDPCAEEEGAAQSVRLAVVEPRTGNLAASFFCLRRPDDEAGALLDQGAVWRHSRRGEGGSLVKLLPAEALDGLLVAASREVDQRAFSAVSEKLRLLTNSWRRNQS